ncbi:DUF4150 domain-containing protein [Archangium gephyra]|nr:DUF4150 domain-containing protein [Archangium gephyra]
MSSVSVNPPKTPVTEGTNGVAAATLPNVCKMPGPPAPFVPTPLPNIGKSGTNPKDYSKTVTIEGKKVAIRGATFGSMGDVASKATGGGIVSSNVEGPTSFVGPGSMDVKLEGKNVQLLGDPMLNNCGPSGNPSNAATMMGVFQEDGTLTVVTGDDECPACHAIHGKDGALSETDATKKHAGQLANNLTGSGFTENTMLGVVKCECEANIYANCSGYQPRRDEQKFCDTVKELSWHGPPEKRKSVKAFLDGRLEGRKQELEDAWTEANARHSLFQRDKNMFPAAYPPGSCAGPKTLMLALEHGAHPASLTERWFAMSAKAEVTVMYLDRESRVPIRGKFKSGDTVPPCDSCNVVIPLLICPEERGMQCQHKT